MTGFGQGEAPLGEGLVRVELRAVNHRHLDLRVRSTGEGLDLSSVVEDILRGQLGRGRVEAQVRWDLPVGAQQQIDLDAARRLYAALSQLRDELNPGESIPVSALLSVPGVLRGNARSDRQAAEAAAAQAAQRAVAALTEMREREGAALARDLEARCALLRAHVAWIEAQRPRVLAETRDRLQARIAKLLEGSETSLDTARLVQEVAWFAERSDVSEETTRLSSHLAELERTLSAPAEGAHPVAAHGPTREPPMAGRKLDFLMQELARETNTIGSKANDAALSLRVVEMKAELERIREQVQNIL
jgi:uncharacterized protein (TIGR00255 family)